MCVREIPHQQAVSVRDFRVEQRVITEYIYIYIYIYILTLACQNDPKPHTRILNENAELQAIIQLKLQNTHKLIMIMELYPNTAHEFSYKKACL